jgi:4-hydroxy-tetrahydrodipicolinate synthase
MCRVGADYILTATPYYNKPSQGGLYRHFSAIADASSKPICLYNVPGRTAVNLQPGIALQLAEHANVMGIKEASGDLAQIMQILRGRPERFSVLSGDDWLTLAVVAAGGDGLISVASNELPGQVRAMVALMLAGELEKAREWHYRLLPLMEANFLESNPAPVKAALALAGKIRNELRLPLVPVTEKTRATLATVLKDLGVAV